MNNIAERIAERTGFEPLTVETALFVATCIPAVMSFFAALAAAAFYASCWLSGRKRVSLSELSPVLVSEPEPPKRVAASGLVKALLDRLTSEGEFDASEEADDVLCLKDEAVRVCFTRGGRLVSVETAATPGDDASAGATDITHLVDAEYADAVAAAASDAFDRTLAARRARQVSRAVDALKCRPASAALSQVGYDTAAEIEAMFRENRAAMAAESARSAPAALTLHDLVQDRLGKIEADIARLAADALRRDDRIGKTENEVNAAIASWARANETLAALSAELAEFKKDFKAAPGAMLDAVALHERETAACKTRVDRVEALVGKLSSDLAVLTRVGAVPVGTVSVQAGPAFPAYKPGQVLNQAELDAMMAYGKK